VLGTRKAQFPAQILDESARGFGVLVEADAEFAVGDTLILASDTGWSQVRVANVDDVPEGKRVGLERLRDVAAAPVPSHPSTWQLLRPMTRSLLVLGALFSLSLVGAVVGPMLFDRFDAAWRPAAPSFVDSPGQAPRAADTRRRQNRAPKRRSSTSGKSTRQSPGMMDKVGAAASAVLDATQSAGSESARQAAEAGDAAAETASKIGALTQRRLNAWRDQLDGLPWEPTQLVALVTYELTQLELTPEQQELVALVIGRAIADMQAVANRIGAGIDGLRIAERLEASCIQEVIAIFTPQQREKWSQLVAERDASGSPDSSPDSGSPPSRPHTAA
jgi:hypothetical protein